MAKTEKELQEMKKKVEALNKEPKELTEEELSQVSGGYSLWEMFTTPGRGQNGDDVLGDLRK